MGWGPGSDLHHAYYPGRESLVLIFVSVLQECLGLLSLGLVQRWGEELPGWIPWVGGRRFHPLVAVVPAALGAIALTGITVLGASTWNEVNAANPDAPTGRPCGSSTCPTCPCCSGVRCWASSPSPTGGAAG